MSFGRWFRYRFPSHPTLISDETDSDRTPAADGSVIGGAKRRPHWEGRLLGSGAGWFFRALVRLFSRSFLIYYRYAPSTFPRSWIWENIGYRFVFSRGYTDFAKTVFGVEIECTMADLIERYVMFFGVWEPNLTAFLQRRLRTGDVFIDLGANVGYFTLLASRLVGETGTVVAIEAAPHIFSRLKKNLRRNKVTNVRAIEIAVAGGPGNVDLYTGGHLNSGATTTIASRGAERVAQVRAESFDRIVNPEEFARARVIKIDIEGAELPPLMTLLKLAPALRNDVEVVVELSPDSLPTVGGSPTEIVETFENAGFHAYDLQNSYDINGYFQRRPPVPPRRIRNPVVRQIDVVFSRKEQEVL
jgi:FkbM family methyltransferase